MTEIAWLVNLMVKHDLSDEVKKLCLERIGEVESNLASRTPQYAPPVAPQPYLQYPGAVNPVIGPNAMTGNGTINIAPVGQPPLSQAQLRDMQMNGTSVQPQTAQPILPGRHIQTSQELIASRDTSLTTVKGPNKMRGKLNA